MTDYYKADNGIIFPAVTAEQMREIDRIALEQTGPNLFQMMENAGRNLAVQTMAFLQHSEKSRTALILAGSGGNGGGGICAARHLLNHGVQAILCLAKPLRPGTVPFFQKEIFEAGGGKTVEKAELDSLKPDVLIDALIGYSLRGTPRASVAELIRWANRQVSPTLSLDVPSGVNATSGETPGVFIQAAQTLPLALPKTGLSEEQCGELFLADIGIPGQIYKRIGINDVPRFDFRYILPIRPLK